MNSELLAGLVLTLLPVFELRGGLPLVVHYVMRNSLPLAPYFLLVILLNILVIFPIFLFMDFIHESLMKGRLYERIVGARLARIQKKSRKVNKDFKKIGFLALTLFVSVPLPGTGAWTGSLIAWFLGLNRLRSFLAISAGVLLAGILVLVFSLGIFSGFY